MRVQPGAWTLALALVAGGRGLAGERGDPAPPQLAPILILVRDGTAPAEKGPSCPPPGQHILQRFHPVGGWHPDDGGLLHWWPKNCFPRCGAPDDYCRKPPPCVCWPPYPPYYIWGPPEVCCPQGGCRPASKGAH